MISEELYMDYEDEYSEDTFEKFAHKTKQKVDKRTSKDLINAERRKKMAEREELAETELSVVIV